MLPRWRHSLHLMSPDHRQVCIVTEEISRGCAIPAVFVTSSSSCWNSRGRGGCDLDLRSVPWGLDDFIRIRSN